VIGEENGKSEKMEKRRRGRGVGWWVRVKEMEGVRVEI
jgi:hypothetical protein